MPTTTRTTRTLSKNIIKALRPRNATNTIKKPKKTTPRTNARDVFTAQRVITVEIDRYLKFLFKNLHTKKLGKRLDINDFKEVVNDMIFEEQSLIKLIHKYTRFEKNVPMVKKIYKEILKEYKDEKDFYLSPNQEKVLKELVFPKNYLPDEYGAGKKTKKANKKKDNKRNNTKKCVKIQLGPNPPFHEAVIYELFVEHTNKKIKDKDYDVMMKSLQKYKPDSSCVTFPASLIGKSKDVEVPFSMSLKDARKLVKKSK